MAAREARDHLGDRLDAAYYRGEVTVVTKNGAPRAVIAPCHPRAHSGLEQPFEEIRAAACRVLADVENQLKYEWTPGTGPTGERGDAFDKALVHIAAAKAALAQPSSGSSAVSPAPQGDPGLPEQADNVGR